MNLSTDIDPGPGDRPHKTDKKMNELQKLQTKLAGLLNTSINAINADLAHKGPKTEGYVVVSLSFEWQIVYDYQVGLTQAPLHLMADASRMTKEQAECFVESHKGEKRIWVAMETRDYLERLLSNNKRRLKAISEIN